MIFPRKSASTCPAPRAAMVNLVPPGRYVPWDPHADPSQMGGRTDDGSVNEISETGCRVNPFITEYVFGVADASGVVNNISPASVDSFSTTLVFGVDGVVPPVPKEPR
ncbi:MAG: hypothetical protein ACD_48C00103G0010 [uncultured bacterium]|nr:MAG: hypothetical protein ACD_48C00103G0010 [uncultured bacterium]